MDAHRCSAFSVINETNMLLRRRLICVRRCDVVCRFLSNEYVGDDDSSASDYQLQERFEAAEEDRPSTSLLKVKEFFQKHKPAPKPPAPQPKKEWLLRRLPEPEEVLEKQEDAPPIGDIEAERKWLNFGDNQTRGRQPLITHSREFRRMARHIEHDMDPRRVERPRNIPGQKVSRAFTPNSIKNSTFRQYNRPGYSGDWQGDWLHQSGSPGQSAESYEDVDAYLDQKSGRSVAKDPPAQMDGFVDFMKTMRENASQAGRSSTVPDERNASASEIPVSTGGQPEEITLQTENTQKVTRLDGDEALEEAVFGRLVMEELSEEAFLPPDDDPPTYDYNPPRPKWLTPPDGDCVGAPPQRQYNDFIPGTGDQDFWNKSSANTFEDPGQDPGKSNRHKLYGQEYWVARPMLMEKYDYEEDEGAPEILDDKHKDLDPEIPRHFVEEDGTISKLTIPERRTYPNFFDPPSKRLDRFNERKLFSMNGTHADPYTKSVRLSGKTLRVEGKVVPGYEIDKDDQQTNLDSEEIKGWLYETPSVYEDGYNRLTDPSLAGREVDDAKTLLRLDGYGKLERYVTRINRIPIPSAERLERIKVLEGLQPPEKIDGEAMKEFEEVNGSERYYSKVNTQALHRIMKAERRYRDMFTNELSDELPVMYPRVEERLQSLAKLNQPDTPENRPQNQLLHQPSRKDFDPWMLKELQKYKKDGDSYEDIFSLACQPRMLEIAFQSLKKRRPGTVPKALENNIYEMASRMLLGGDLKLGVTMTPKKPRIDAGKGARSTRIPSHNRKELYKESLRKKRDLVFSKSMT